MAHDIFISYSHKDKVTADAICSHLEARGMRCWYAPRDITPGEEWGNAILQGIESARIMVLVFTTDANLSQQVLREVNNAVNAGLAIIPFRLTEEEPTAGMRYYLSTVHWMDAMNEDLEVAIGSLGDLCRAVLDKKAVPKVSAGTGIKSSKGAVSEPAAGRSKKTALIAGIAAAAVVIVAVVFLLLRRGAAQGSGTPSDTEEPVVTAEESTAEAEESIEEEKSEEAETSTVSFVSGDPSEKTAVEHDEASEEILALGATADNVTDDLSVTYTDGNNQCNILNGGHLAFDGEWYYYTGNDNDCMHRMKADGSGDEVITDIPARYINVYEGYVYFVSDADELFRIKPDGSERTSLLPYSASYARILNDRIYYGETNLSSIALDGSDERLENEINGNDVVIDGTYTYYTDPDHSSHIYRAKMDGSEAVCIYNQTAGSLRIAGNRLFFYEDSNGWFSYYDITTGEITQLTYDPMNSPVITKDGIYAWSGNMQVVFAPFDQIGIKLLTQGWADTVNVAGEKIFYRDGDDYLYYMMDLDGSNKTKL